MVTIMARMPSAQNPIAARMMDSAGRMAWPAASATKPKLHCGTIPGVYPPNAGKAPSRNAST